MRCRAVQRQAPLRLFSRPGFRWRPPGGCSVRVLSPSGEEGCEPAGLAGAFPILLSPSQSEDLHQCPGSLGVRVEDSAPLDGSAALPRAPAAHSLSPGEYGGPGS